MFYRYTHMLILSISVYRYEQLVVADSRQKQSKSLGDLLGMVSVTLNGHQWDGHEGLRAFFLTSSLSLSYNTANFLFIVCEPGTTRRFDCQWRLTVAMYSDPGDIGAKKSARMGTIIRFTWFAVTCMVLFGHTETTRRRTAREGWWFSGARLCITTGQLRAHMPVERQHTTFCYQQGTLHISILYIVIQLEYDYYVFNCLLCPAIKSNYVLPSILKLISSVPHPAYRCETLHSTYTHNTKFVILSPSLSLPLAPAWLLL